MEWPFNSTENHKMVWADGRPKDRITQQDLVRHVPGWTELLKEARELWVAYRDKVYSSDSLLHRRFDGRPSVRERFEGLIGWHSQNSEPWVHSCRAYEVGCRVLSEAADG